eukprot:1808593-Ditylum_brightwellii.AAC.1
MSQREMLFDSILGYMRARLGSKKVNSSGCTGVIVDMGNGSTKRATVLIWSCSKLHPTKPKTYAEAYDAKTSSREGNEGTSKTCCYEW